MPRNFLNNLKSIISGLLGEEANEEGEASPPNTPPNNKTKIHQIEAKVGQFLIFVIVYLMIVAIILVFFR